MYTPNKAKLEEITKQVTKDGEMVAEPICEEEMDRFIFDMSAIGGDGFLGIDEIMKKSRARVKKLLSFQRDYYKGEVKKMKIPENLEMGGPTPKQAFNFALDMVISLLSKKKWK